MALSFSDIEFSLNLTDVTQNELLFLKRVDDLQYLNDPNVIVEAVRRYETLWLPLISDYQGIIAAQMDIYWIWHTHMLSPLFYKKDMEKKFGKIINHTFLDDKTYESALNDIEALWISKYPHEPFELRITDLNVKTTFQSQFLYDVKSAAERQSSFYYQVSLPHFKSQLFLQQSLERYKMFLSLKRKYPNIFLVPCYDIDLIWHCHQVHPILYAQDCKKILGRLLPHDDSVNDRSPDSELMAFDKETRKLWLKNFKISFANSGCMFRGDSSRGKLIEASKIWLTWMLSPPEEFNIKISKIKSEKCNYKLNIYLIENSRKKKCVLSYDYSTKIIKQKKICKFSKNKKMEFQFELVKKTGTFEKNVKCSSISGSLNNFENQNEDEINITWPIKIDNSIFDIVEIQFLKILIPFKYFVGQIFPGDFYFASVQLPNQKIFGPITISSVDNGKVQNLFGFHSVKSQKGQTIFNVNVIHIKNFKQSIIQVLCDKKMSTIAHLIENEQLPDYSQTEDPNSFPQMQSSKYDRAIIIKDNQGDWVVVIARWLCLKIPSPSSKKNLQNQRGYFSVRMFHLRNENQNQCFILKRKKNGFFTIENLELNFKNGSICIRSAESITLVPNYICLAFSISVLLVLCKPRHAVLESEFLPANQKEVLNNIPKWSNDTDNEVIELSTDIKKLNTKTKQFTRCKFDQFQLCLAGGYLFDSFIPSNSYWEYFSISELNSECLGHTCDLFFGDMPHVNGSTGIYSGSNGGCIGGCGSGCTGGGAGCGSAGAGCGAAGCAGAGCSGGGGCGVGGCGGGCGGGGC